MNPTDPKRIVRREALEVIAGAGIVAAGCTPSQDKASPRASDSSARAPNADTAAANPMGAGETNAGGEPGAVRKLGKTGLEVEPVSLGGEGILRTTGRFKEAVPMILEALRLGVRYCDTAPAYQQSQDYYGEAFKAAGQGARERVILASKTHERTEKGALRLLDDSLRRLGTDHLDIWQLHDLRTIDDLDEIFAKHGAIHAVEKAKAEKRIRFVGITGHHDPAILVEAMRRYPFDTVLCAINPSDPRRMPFLQTVVPEARKRGMGIVGMKVMSAGRLLNDRTATSEELIRYATSFADTSIIGCSSIQEVRENLRIGRAAEPLSPDAIAALEARIAPNADRYDYYKA
ncbi:MAG: aldo/keto reductase [Polyangiaceae bacterium]|nr:aldo/keto reductase [Polyangiaceae bacterium]